MSAVFLPRGADNIELPMLKDHTYFVFDESDGAEFEAQRVDMVAITPDESMFYQAADWLNDSRRRWLK